MSPAAERIVRRLDDTRQRWWLLTLLTTTVMAVCLSLAVFLVFIVWDAAARLSQAWLGLMFVGWLAVTVAVVIVVIRRLLFSQRSMEATARRVESEFPQVGSNLINLVQLAETEGEGWEFRLAAVNRAAASVQNVEFHRAAGKLSRWKRFTNCMQTTRDLLEWFAVFGLLVALTLACAAWLPGLGSAALRLLTPWQFTPSVGAVNIVEVAPGDAEVLLGGRLTITAEIDNPQSQSYRSALFIAREDQLEVELPMTTDSLRQRYAFTVPAVEGPFSYRVEIGDSQSAEFDISVRQKPAIERIEVTLRFPAYMGRRDRTEVRKHADLKAPRGTVAQLRVHPRTPVGSGYYQSGKKQKSGRLADDGAVVFDVPMMESGTFTIHLVDDAGFVDPNPRVNRIVVVPDEPPAVQLLKPPIKTTAAPGDVLPLAVRAVDDHGLSRVLLEMKPAEVVGGDEMDRQSAAGQTPTTIVEWADFEGGSAAVRSHGLKLSADEFQLGQTVQVRAVAWDNRSLPPSAAEPGPQRTVSAWHSVKIVDSREKAAADSARRSELEKELRAILDLQLAARKSTAKADVESDAIERADIVSQVRSRQVQIRGRTWKLVEELVGDVAGSQAEMMPVLADLVGGPMIEAVVRCDRMMKASDEAEISTEIDALAASQDAIIRVLRQLLAGEEGEEAQLEEEDAGGMSEQIAAERQSKLAELGEKLDKFQDEQKRVIEETKKMAESAEKPESAQQRKEKADNLADAQKNWAETIQQAREELDEEPDREPSESSVSEKLSEIETELEKAEEALREEETATAVEAEEAAAEKAEQLKKELEESPGDDLSEDGDAAEESPEDESLANAAEEPAGELEELVEELIDKEQELFNEIEGGSSGSGDNRADTSEDEAVEKTGGGNIEGQSESEEGDGQGGAGSGDPAGEEETDGEAGGGEDDDGQGPDDTAGSPGTAREMKELAEKQKELLDKAEAIDSQLEIEDYHRGDLQKMIRLMQQVERDLRAGRRQEALRQRDILAGGLGRLKKYIRGEFQVRRDRTGNLPGEIQKEILSGAGDPSPDGWDELNQQYFKRLAE